MTTPRVLQLMGAPGSPYTRKMLAVLRYRRIPYAFLTPAMAAARGLPQPKVPLLPTFYLPAADGALEPATDSSPLIRRFDRAFEGRHVLPADPALAFIDMLLEDYADEWLTKAMFHYRWAFAADAQRSGRVLPMYRGLSRPDAELAEAGQAFAARQIGRLKFVGSNAVTGPVIEASYARLLGLLDAHFRGLPFLMGARPGSSDFALYGQLTQLAAFDPTPMATTLEVAPRVYAWTALAEDLSGLEPGASDWIEAAALPATLRAILAEVGRTYVPVMLANARAVAARAATVETTVDGEPWSQQPFPYQAKCVVWLREAYAGLEAGPRASVDAALAGTGCEALVA
ncbi:MAG: glutathione S-transferase N-terminal domain-containing protein [Hyphomicrobiaceae bacterium]|nr:glutathione S-transferase N-terminal domain-containing protein [Hyphomicrobiaceae bacterium]